MPAILKTNDKFEVQHITGNLEINLADLFSDSSCLYRVFQYCLIQSNRIGVLILNRMLACTSQQKTLPKACQKKLAISAFKGQFRRTLTVDLQDFCCWSSSAISKLKDVQSQFAVVQLLQSSRCNRLLAAGSRACFKI